MIYGDYIYNTICRTFQSLRPSLGQLLSGEKVEKY